MKQKAHQILKWSEHYLKTDMVYLTRGGFWLTVGQGTSSLLSLILATAFAHFISKEVYGNYKYILSLTGMFSMFSLTGIGTALVRSIAKGYDGTLRYNFWLNIRWSIIIFLGSLVSSLYYFYNDNYTLGASFLIIGSFSPFMTSASLHGAYLSGKKDFRRSSLYNIYKRIVPTVALLGTMMLSNNVIVLVLVYFASNTSIILYYYLKTLRAYHIDKNAPIDPDNLHYAKHLSLMNILSGIADKIDSVLVFHYFGAASLSVYTFSTAIPEQIIGWIKNINTLALPKFTGQEKGIVKKELWAKFSRFFIVLIAIFLAYYVSAPYIYKYAFPNYLESVKYSQLYSVMIILTASTLNMIFLQAHKAIKENYIINIFSSTCRISLVTILIINYGITGAIIGQLLAKAMAGTLSFILVKRF
ncbi:MAG: hypothetical protein RLZZ347_467 [Candidatus Parcubacteria bacterium]|jgi:O-antigen/teichoic acid export membrane protein